MEELSEIIKALELEEPYKDEIVYDYIEIFKNPNKLPITQVHLERFSLELRKDFNLNNVESKDDSELFERKTVVVPALDKSWLPDAPPLFDYDLHNIAKTNTSYVSNNRLFLESLKYLLRCNYHQFWCSVLYEPRVLAILHSFILHPMLSHEIQQLDDSSVAIYESVFHYFRLVYRRLFIFKESESEFMPQDVALKFVLEKKLLNLPIVLTLIFLYEDVDSKFINQLVSLYFEPESVFRDREIEEMLNQVLMTLEMIGGHVCGFEKGAVIVPIAIEERPAVFSLSWVYTVVNYLFYTICTLNILLRFYKPAVELALTKGIPYRLSFTYEHVYFNLYDYLNGRQELETDQGLSETIFEVMALGRSEFIDVFNCFVSHCLDKALESAKDLHRQQDVVETYLKIMTTALEDEYFICDYHEKYDVGLQNEMFISCTDLDATRSDYILNCIKSLRRHNRLWKALKCDKTTLWKAVKKYAARREKQLKELQANGDESEAGSSSAAAKTFNLNPSEEEIEDLIKIVIDMFPHLGDGFVLQCLEAYNFQASDVISAILEENLPPHIVDIPFDLIRIPPEPKPAEPILAYRGKKPDYDDALKLLNDKRDMKEIKTFVLDGLQYTNEYDVYDDEYDDRLDEEIVKVPDYGSEDVLKYNPNYEDDAVSDTSYSENEYDDKGVPVAAAAAKPKGKGDFCENPEVVRARREARYRSRGRGRDVVGKPKGEGQDKNVLHNRQKKTVNKSSRANHNRKGGAAFKRNKGMVPS